MKQRKLLRKLGWRGQCSCCNSPKDKKAIRQEEQKEWKDETIFEAGWGIKIF